MGLDFVERRKQSGNGLFVCFLRGRETGFVYPVVDVVVNPVVGRLDVGAEGFWERVDFGIGFGQEGVEFVVEHSDYF